MARRKITAATFTMGGRVSPDDVRFLELERDARLKADRRTDLERYFGDPDYARSALAEYRQRQAERSQAASDDV